MMKQGRIYIAESKDGKVLQGGAKDIERALGLGPSYAAYLARTGTVTRDGWKVRLCGIDLKKAHTRKTGKIYVATKQREDPIIGCIHEISVLTGIPNSTLLNALKSGYAACQGWHLRLATNEEIETSEQQWEA